MNQILIQKLIEMEDLIVPTLFKPVQFNILKKLNVGGKLNENEKRYLRGKMKSKLNILNEIMIYNKKEMKDYIIFLNGLDSYYITGLEALKHNGFGWYFKPKIIEVINTKIKGRVVISNKILKFIRIKSIKNNKFSIDKKIGLRYATNEQIIKDIYLIKNEYAKNVWEQMLLRYGKLFIKNPDKFKLHAQRIQIIDYAKYGV